MKTHYDRERTFVLRDGANPRRISGTKATSVGGITAASLAAVVVILAKAFGWELPLSEVELLTLAGFALLAINSLSSWFQRRATERVEMEAQKTRANVEQMERERGTVGVG